MTSHEVEHLSPRTCRDHLIHMNDQIHVAEMPLEGLDEARLAGPSVLDAEAAKVVDENRANFISKCTDSFDLFDGGLSQISHGCFSTREMPVKENQQVAHLRASEDPGKLDQCIALNNFDICVATQILRSLSRQIFVELDRVDFLE